MLAKHSSEKISNFRQGAAPLFAASFLFSGAHGGIFSLALPFVIVLIGGSDKDLGLCYGLGTVAYVITCLAIARHLDRFNPKRLLQTGSLLIALSVAAIFIITQLTVLGRLPVQAVPAATVINTILSILLALFWPPMMGWLSIGHEGPSLSRRMGRFNLSWSAAMAVTPLMAGFIVQKNPNGAVLTAAFILLLSFVCISVAASPSAPSRTTKSRQPAAPLPDETRRPVNAAFCAMSRSALFTSCVVFGLLRTQFALLFTDTLGYSESQFGILTTVLCVASLAGFYVTGKTHRWHHRRVPFVTAQVMIAAALVLILYGHCLGALWVAMILIGLGQSFIYAGHQYYAVSGQKDRAKPMAIHEILIGAGYSGGAIGGGYLAEYVNRFTPYQLALAAVLIALLIQCFIFGAYKRSAALQAI